VNPLTAFVRTKLLDLCAWRLLFNCKPLWLNDEHEDGAVWIRARKELLDWMTGKSDPDDRIVLPGCDELSTPAAPRGRASAWSDGATFANLRSTR
jgi:hypothetical protein